jgi:hypothetical protein
LSDNNIIRLVRIFAPYALLGHANGDITTHYSAAELGELLAAAEKIVDRSITQSPTLTVVRRTTDKVVGKVSEDVKVLSGNIC